MLASEIVKKASCLVFNQYAFLKDIIETKQTQLLNSAKQGYSLVHLADVDDARFEQVMKYFSSDIWKKSDKDTLLGNYGEIIAKREECSRDCDGMSMEYTRNELWLKLNNVAL